MKKLITLLLVLVTVVGLAACGKEEPATEPPATETPESTYVLDMTPHIVEGKQVFWEQVFKKGTVKTASDSFTMTICDLLIQAQRDKNHNIFVGYGSIHTPKEMPLAIYISKNKEGYLHNRYMDTSDKYPDENSEWFEVDTWTSLTFEREDDKKALDTFLQNLQDAVCPVNQLVELIERIEYVHTINNQDYIKAYYTEIDKAKAPALIPTRGASVRIYGLYECVVDEEIIQFIYLEENINGKIDTEVHFINYTANSTYSYDAANKMMLLNNEKYRCTMVVDYSKLELPTIEYCVELVMEPKTQSIYSMKGELQGVPIFIEFTQCEKAYDVMDLPFFTEEDIEFANIAKDYLGSLAIDMAFEILYYKSNANK